MGLSVGFGVGLSVGLAVGLVVVFADCRSFEESSVTETLAFVVNRLVMSVASRLEGLSGCSICNDRTPATFCFCGTSAASIRTWLT